jgi:hypothetical protein
MKIRTEKIFSSAVFSDKIGGNYRLGIIVVSMSRFAQRARMAAGKTMAAQYPGYLPPILNRPTGTEYVRYEDLVQGSDDVTTSTVGSQTIYQFGDGVFQTIIERCPANKWITFPAGVFEINTPGWDAAGGIAGSGAVRWPKTSYGAIGNYPPGTGWDDLAPDTLRTVFRVKENTAPAQNVAGSWFQAGYSGSVRQTWANIHFEGTEQGMQSSGDTGTNSGPGNDGTSHRLFTNVYFYNVADDSSARDILSTGSFGNNGAPPGETFAFEWYNSTTPVLCRIAADGRRAVGGDSYSGAGITFGNTLGGIMTDCYAHHNGQAGIVFYQTANCLTYGCRLGDPNDHTTNHVNGSTHGNWLNHERTTGSVHTDMNLHVYSVGRSQVEHISHSNDSFTLSRSGQNIPIDNGTLKLVNQTHSQILFSGSGYPLTIATWIPYSSGNTMTQANTPIVVQSDGVTAVPAKWNYGGTWLDI